MPLVKNTTTGNNYLVKINTDGDSCSRTAIRSYDKQYGSNGVDANSRFYLPFTYDPSSHTLWVFVNGEKAVVEQTATTDRQYEELDNRSIRFGNSLGNSDVLEFIVAGSYLNESDTASVGGGLTWLLTADDGLNMVDSYGYMTNTSGGPITFNLPETPSEGDTFAVADAFGSFGTNPATLNRLNPLHKIDHAEQNFVFDEDGMSAQFVFDGIDNWLIVSDSGFVTSGEWITTDINIIANVNGKYMVDTLGGVVSVQCPPNPNPNDWFVVSDYSGSFFTNNCTVTQNGENIMGFADDLNINVDNTTVKLVYIDSSQGWKIVTVSS